MSEGNRNRKETRVGSLREGLESNIRMIEKTVWQDGKDCTLDVPVNLQNNRIYGKEKKADIPDKNLLSLTNKMSKKNNGIHNDFIVWCNRTLLCK